MGLYVLGQPPGGRFRGSQDGRPPPRAVGVSNDNNDTNNYDNNNNNTISKEQVIGNI